MAMNKKEQAQMQAAIDRAETLAALRWTNPVPRDVGIPETGYSQGWDYNTWAQQVFIGWSCRVADLLKIDRQIAALRESATDPA
ncbi:MAG: hypothetical protein LW834_01960 [Cyanobium sp. 49614_E6]|nr:hypothetical protein [Cyanobium sp. 49614_E6]